MINIYLNLRILEACGERRQTEIYNYERKKKKFFPHKCGVKDMER